MKALQPKHLPVLGDEKESGKMEDLEPCSSVLFLFSFVLEVMVVVFLVSLVALDCNN